MLGKQQGKLVLLTIGVFAVAGLGLGLTGYVGMRFAEDTLGGGSGDAFADAFVALIFIQSVLVTLFAGPIVAVISGIISGHVLQDRVGGLLVGGAGSFVGFFIMIVLAVFVMSMGFSGTGTGGGGATGGGGETLQNTFRPIIQSAIPTTIAGAIAGVLGGMYVNK